MSTVTSRYLISDFHGTRHPTMIILIEEIILFLLLLINQRLAFLLIDGYPSDFAPASYFVDDAL